MTPFSAMPSATPPRTLRAVAACMKDEGLILLEWVAHHRALGFDRIFVATNDCTDGTDAMLDRLAATDGVIHIRNTPAPGEAPQIAGTRAMLAHPAMADVAWLLHIDADEFLNVTCGAGTVADLLAATGDAHCIALAWRSFGAGGWTDWTPGLVTERLTGCEGRPRPAVTFHKSMFRPDRFGRATDHMPKDPAGPVTLKNSAGRVMDPAALRHPTQARHRTAQPRDFTWANACLHHYAIRSEDIFLLKNFRGDGMLRDVPRYRRGSVFWRRADRNDVQDTSIQRHLQAVRATLDRWRRDDPALARLEAEAYAWFDERRRRLLTPAARAALTVTVTETEDPA